MNPLFIAIFALIFALLSAFVAVWAVYHAAASSKHAADCATWMAESNKRAKIVRLEAEITEIVDSMASIRESLHKMRSRLAMRERREQEKPPDKPLYDETPEGRDAERAALEAELAQAGKLNPKIHMLGQNNG